MKAKSIYTVLLICTYSMLYSQIGINNPNPDPAAALDIQSNDKGILIPRMGTSDRLLIDPVPNGLLVFDDETESFWMYKTGGWSELSDDDNDKSPTNEKILSINATSNSLTINEGGTNLTTPLADNIATNELITHIIASGSNLTIYEPNNVKTVNLDNFLRDYINTNCYIYFGWRDFCDGCSSSPTKYGRSNGNNGGNTVGTDNTLGSYSLFGQQVRMFGLNTDGDVDGSDKFYIGFKCQ